MKSMADVLIVGGGPAGLVVAERLASSGAAVLVFDKKPSIGIRPIRCGEAFGPADGWPAEIPFDSSWVESKIRAVAVEAPEGTHYELDRPNLGWAIDRSIFEHRLAERAAAAGAQLLLDCYVIDAQFEETWTIQCNRNGRSEAYSGRFLVGADGVESRVALWAKIRDKRRPIDLCTTAQVHVPLPGHALDVLRFFIGPRFAKNGYAWIFPGVQNRANIGIGVLTTPGRERLDALLREFLAQARIEVPASEPFVYGAIPVGGFDKNPVGSASLLVGDAAGLAYPLSGGGILNALHSGIMAADAIIGWLKGNEKTLRRYPGKLRKRFYWSFQRELWARKLLFSCNDSQIEELLKRTRAALPKDRSSMSEAGAVFCMLKAGVPFLAKKMIARFFLFALLLGATGAQAGPSRDKIASLQAAVAMGERQEYDSSRALFESCLRENPGDPLVLVLRASIDGLRIIDYEDNAAGKRFETDLKRILDSTNTVREHGDYDTAWTSYIRGAAMATLASHWLRGGAYWNGCRLGMKALDALSGVGTVNPPMIDGYLYQGIFDYAKGELEKKLKLILFWRSAAGKAEGIRKLEVCRNQSLFSQTAAAQTLLGIYVREGEWTKAEAIYHQLVTELPQNRPARWTLANAYFETEQWSKAAPLYGELLHLLGGVHGLAAWQDALCQYRLALCARETGALQQCRDLCRRILDRPDNDSRTRAIRKDAQRLLDRVK